MGSLPHAQPLCFAFGSSTAAGANRNDNLRTLPHEVGKHPGSEASHHALCCAVEQPGPQARAYAADGEND